MWFSLDLPALVKKFLSRYFTEFTLHFVVIFWSVFIQCGSPCHCRPRGRVAAILTMGVALISVCQVLSLIPATALTALFYFLTRGTVYQVVLMQNNIILFHRELYLDFEFSPVLCRLNSVVWCFARLKDSHIRKNEDYLMMATHLGQ